MQFIISLIVIYFVYKLFLKPMAKSFLKSFILNAGTKRPDGIEAKYLIALLAKVAKSDGRVNELEARLISEILDDMEKFSGLNRNELKEIYNFHKENINDAYDLAREYKNTLLISDQIAIARIRFFLNMAYIDGSFSSKERKVIQDISRGLGLSDIQLSRLIEPFEIFYNQRNFQSHFNQDHSQNFHQKQTYDPYKVLGLSDNASFDEVKKRYRKLVKEYHPDILMGRGESEEMINKSTIKLQEINEAYEIIKAKY